MCERRKVANQVKKDEKQRDEAEKFISLKALIAANEKRCTLETKI